jgi:fumarate reductase flavoprotein subunit
MKTDFDVIVVGGGGSGLAAAVSAAENGLDVLVLEKRSECGGTTGIAVGSFSACNTALQRSRGIEDHLEAHAEDVAKFAPPLEVRNNAALRRFFLSESAATLDWLTGMGLAFQGPNPEPPNRVPRMHNVVPGAAAYIAVLRSRLLRLGGRVLCRSAVQSLLKRNGRVIGARTCRPQGVQDFHARRGVVLAAGDYANSPEMISRYKDPRFSGIEGINPHATGDGHRLALEAGAALLNMDVTYGPEIRFVAPEKRSLLQRLPSQGPLARIAGWLTPRLPEFLIRPIVKRLVVTWQHPENGLFDHGAILINLDGKHFCNERAWPDREIAIAAQPQKTCFLLLDGKLVEQYSAWPHFISTAPRIAYAYVADYERLRPDIAVRRMSLAAAARARGLPATIVEQTVADHNRTAERPLNGGPWVLLGPAKAYFTTTEGGAVVNERLGVLDEAGRCIPGLYAVGQNGLGGQILWGHGLHIAWAITSGRLVGKQLAATAANE